MTQSAAASENDQGTGNQLADHRRRDDEDFWRVPEGHFQRTQLASQLPLRRAGQRHLRLTQHRRHRDNRKELQTRAQENPAAIGRDFPRNWLDSEPRHGRR